MINSTEAQLKNITAKSDQLETLMTGKIDEVRNLQSKRDEYEREVMMLRSRLEEAEGRFAGVQGDLDQKTTTLKTVADEYNKAQLLKKKYQNTLNELKGCPRVILRVRDPAHYDGVQQISRPGARHDWGAITIADNCTLNVPSKSKSFVFDSVITPDDPQTPFDVYKQLSGDAMLHDVLLGFNTTLFTFGQTGSGKSFSLLGPAVDHHHQQPGGVIDVFISNLFAQMERNDVDCFTIKAQMLELIDDSIFDLFSDPSNSDRPHGPHYEVLRDDKGRVHVPGLQQVSVNKSQQLSQLFHWGLKTREKRREMGDRRKSHLMFSCSVENYSKKGDFRRAKLAFVDIAGCSAGLGEEPWIVKSNQAVGDVISVLSSAAQQRSSQPTARGNVPYRNSKLTMLLSDALGGNCKTTMLCSVIPSPSLLEELLTALIYAYHLKCIRNAISPYDIPADLQKLEEEIRSIDFGPLGA
eukprot:TRINITY_DN2194_c1_g2_i1.p1 TRINITY_DN2194_c1_g2~~TRINITY_DN2194_c1_g2_i1.p1  ORF type:complete len:495 (+),score=102.97 TRINITY_DN2194_c1_g2_i1:86-1486(+)